MSMLGRGLTYYTELPRIIFGDHCSFCALAS